MRRETKAMLLQIYEAACWTGIVIIAVIVLCIAVIKLSWLLL